MFASLPPVPGYAGPFSLKAFLHTFFSLSLHFTAPPDTGNYSQEPPISDRCVHLPSTGTFAITVYVSLAAPPAPPRPDRTTSAATKSSLPPAQHQQLRHCVHARRRSLMTHTVLAHPIWASLLHQIGPSVSSFVLAFCPLVVQFAPGEGGLQVLGPRLTVGLPRLAGQKQGRRQQETEEMCRKRVRVEGEGDDGGGRSSAGTGSHTDTVAFSIAMRSITPTRAPVRNCLLQSCNAFIYRSDVPRTVLLGGPVGRLKPRDTGGHDAGATVPPEVPDGWLEALWLQRHPRSLACALKAQNGGSHSWRTQGNPRYGGEKNSNDANVYLHRGDSDQSTEVYIASDEVSLLTMSSLASREVAVSAEVAQAIFPITFASPARFTRTTAAAAALPSSMELCGGGQERGEECQRGKPFDKKQHLAKVISLVLTQCAAMDLRGAALRHFGFLETRFQQQHQRQQGSYNVHQLTAPVDVVVSYLIDLLERLRYTSNTNAVTEEEDVIEPSSIPSSSFWGVDAVSAASTLKALGATLTAWILSGRKDVFHLSQFLHKAQVAKIPWLRGFYTSTTSITRVEEVCRDKNKGAALAMTKSRRRRSMVQQQVYLQFVFFLTQHVVPTLIRRALHVTWSSGSPNTFIFLPWPVWRSLMRKGMRELLRLHHHNCQNDMCSAKAKDNVLDNNTDSFTSVVTVPSLVPVLGTRSIFQQAATTTIGGSLSSSSSAALRMLYASIHFLPERKKLRPIAVMRSTHPASLVRWARTGGKGISPSACVALSCLRRYARSGDWTSSSPSSLPCSFSTCRSMPAMRHRFAGPSSTVLRRALLCLMCGFEENFLSEGRPKLSNLTHQDEYLELRSFTQAVRRECGSSGGGESGIPQDVTYVRGDASRCYDNLPQSAVLGVVDTLVAHAWYYVLGFTAILPFRGRVRLQSHRMMVDDKSLTTGALRRIPAGWIVYEEDTNSSDGSGGLVTPSATSSSPAPVPPPFITVEMISGAEVRATLREHLSAHLVALDGRLYRQHVGITQGSPVAMLLCDVLLHTIDLSLSQILEEHAEPSMLLRRVDDVLVATMSPIAAQRCAAALHRGWPEVGYRCNPDKMLVRTGSGCYCSGNDGAAAAPISFVPWCGLLLCADTCEVALEWARVLPLVSLLRQQPISSSSSSSFMHASGGGRVVASSALTRYDSGVLASCRRLLTIVRLRTPPTLLCRCINSRRRVVQTFYEIGLVWSRLALRKVADMLAFAHGRLELPSPSSSSFLCQQSSLTSCSLATGSVPACLSLSLLLYPLQACIHALLRMLRHHRRVLEGCGSWCDVTEEEVRLCVLLALHRTLQKELRGFMRSARGSCDSSCADFTAYRDGDFRERQQRQQHQRWQRQRWWWQAAVEVQRRVRRQFRLCGKVACLLSGADGGGAAALLQETGPGSMTAQALNAVRT